MFLTIKMLRRNARKIIKYSLVALVLIICGLLFSKPFLKIRDMDSNQIETREKYSGLPKSPDEQKVIMRYTLLILSVDIYKYIN